tara:strand:+ start:616 stop:786 length:171 start_codon:yes stop_codon:yes gene_type:complete
MKKLFLFLFLMSCSTPKSYYEVNEKVLDFDKNLTFNQFNELLIKYAEINAYPDIDQ